MKLPLGILKLWGRASRALAAVGACAYLFAIAWLRTKAPTRKPRFEYQRFSLVSSDGTRIRGRHASRGRENLVILCHPAVIGQGYAPLVEMGEMLHEELDVVTFDFCGHGRSGGYLTLDMMGPALNLLSVVRYFRERSYHWIGVVGFSLGGIAAITCASRWKCVDAVVSIGAPPKIPDFSNIARHALLGKLILIPLGFRFRVWGEPVAWPLEMVESVSPIPLLLVHGEKEFTYTWNDFQRMWERAREPKERMVLSAGHADTGEEAHLVVDWIKAAMRKSRVSG